MWFTSSYLIRIIYRIYKDDRSLATGKMNRKHLSQIMTIEMIETGTGLLPYSKIMRRLGLFGCFVRIYQGWRRFFSDSFGGRGSRGSSSLMPWYVHPGRFFSSPDIYCFYMY
jgi:hypothetical protein